LHCPILEKCISMKMDFIKKWHFYWKPVILPIKNSLYPM
jgi:hypothetical protein